MKEKDIKILWGRAANRCAICRCELSQDAKAIAHAFPIGEQAHIVGEQSCAARGESILTAEERNSYHNIVLLCPTHHVEIDKNERDWPIEKLHFAKSAHELWVRETLAEATDQPRLAQEIAVTYIVDSAVDLCHLENWREWTQTALSPQPYWPRSIFGNVFEFRQRVGAAIWPPQFDELRRSTLTLSILLNTAAHNFMKHARSEENWYVADTFYKSGGWNPSYDRDLQLYTRWIEKGYELLTLASGAANWFADVVRRDVNPMFFARTGRFVILEGPFEDLSVYARIVEIPETDRAGMPESLADVVVG